MIDNFFFATICYDEGRGKGSRPTILFAQLIRKKGKINCTTKYLDWDILKRSGIHNYNICKVPHDGILLKLQCGMSWAGVLLQYKLQLFWMQKLKSKLLSFSQLPLLQLLLEVCRYCNYIYIIWQDVPSKALYGYYFIFLAEDLQCLKKQK